jgi:hypothetical protein
MNNNYNYNNLIKIGLLQKYKKSRYFSIISVLSLSLLLLLIISFSIDKVLAQTHSSIVSTRGSFNTTNGNMTQQANLPSALSILNINNCPGELAIYVHGVWATEENANEQTERVSLSLQRIGYNIPVIGFSWDSDTIQNRNGWGIAKVIANENGPILAKFIDSFKDECQESKLRIIAHSLGSRVTLSAIQSLSDNNIAPTITPSKTITSVHLLGAAVDNEQVSMNAADCNFNNPPLPCNGEAIKSEVGIFRNLYNAEDNMLQFAYRDAERDDALGWCGLKGGPQNVFFPWSCVGGDSILTPNNYEEHSVTGEIRPDADADKDEDCDVRMTIFSDEQICTIMLIGDNHFGYMGYRSSTNNQIVSHSGAMEFVVLDWRNENN